MRTLNVRLALICVLVTAVLGGGIHLLHAFQVGRQADTFRIASKQAEEKKDLSEAIRLLQNYVVMAPSDQKEKLRLGQLYAKGNNPGAASELLESVLRSGDPSLTADDLREAHRTLADAALMWRPKRWSDAAEHRRQLLKEDPQNPELLDLYGQDLLGCGKDNEACEQFSKAIEIAPGQINTYFRYAFILSARSDRKADADELMKKMIARNPKSADAYEKYAYYFLEHARFEEALAQALRMLELVPEHPKALWIAGRCSLSLGKYKAAEDYLTRGIRANKSDHAMYKVMADVKGHLNRPDEAMAILQMGLENTKGAPGYAEILWDVINMESASGQFAKAEKDIQELRDLRFEHGARYRTELVDFAEARLAVMKGEWKAAKAMLDDVLPKIQDNPGVLKLAYLYLGQYYHQAGDVERQVISLTEATRIDPYLFAPRSGLADVFLSHGNYAEAAEQYRILMRAPHPDADAAPALARVLIMQQLSLEKDKRDWEPAEKLLSAIEQSRSLSPGLATLEAEVMLAKEQYKEAGKFLADCSQKFPKSAQIWLALTNLAMYRAGVESDPAEKAKGWRQAEEFIEQAEKKLGDHYIVRVARASCAVRRKDPQAQARAVLAACGENCEKLNEAEKKNLWSNLGALCMQANAYDLARSYFRNLAARDPRNVAVRYLLCELNLQVFDKGQTPDLEEVETRLNEIEQLAGRCPYWYYGDAIRILLKAKKTDPQYAQSLLEARVDLQNAMEIRRDWAAPVVLAGKICELQEEPDQALEFYIHAMRNLGERDSDVIRRTVTLLMPRGRVGEAKQLLDYLARQKSPLLGDMQDKITEVDVFMGDIAAAAKEVKKSVSPDSANYKDFLRQGQLFAWLARRMRIKAQGAGQDARMAAEAIDLAQQSVNALVHAKLLDPEADEVWMAIVQLLVDVGQPDKSQQVLDEAEGRHRPPIALAKCYELVGQTEKAQVKYEAAAAASPQNAHVLRQVAAFYLKNNKYELVDPLLKRIVALESPATLTDACWARRAQALVLSRQADFDHLRQALDLLDQNLRSKAAAVEDKRMKVIFLVADPRKQKVGEAIAALEDLVTSTDATAADYFSLAQLYLKKGDWNHFSSAMHNVLGTQKAAVQPGYLVAYINALLDKKMLDDADKWLQFMEKADAKQEAKMSQQERAGLFHNLFDTARLRAEYCLLREKYKTANEVAMAYLDNPDAQPADRGQQLLLVAQLMEKLGNQAKADGRQIVADGFLDKADTLFALQRSKSPVGDIFFAAYMARQKRVRACLAVMEQCAEKMAPENLVLPGQALLDSHAADASQLPQVERILTAAAARAQRPVTLLMLLARLHEEQRQFDKSIADYREILMKAPRHYEAMNNLALNLARTGQNLDEALKLVDEALQIAGPMANILDSRAIIHIARQEYEEALKDATAAIADEGTAEQYFHQAWAYSMAGKKIEAAAAITEATKQRLDPKKLDASEVAVFERLRNDL